MTDEDEFPSESLKNIAGRGRPISQETKLGRMMFRRGLRAYYIAARAGFSSRVMTEYCAGRRPMNQEHLLALCRVLECEPYEILDDVEEGDDYMEPLHDAEQTLPSHQTKTVKDLQREHRMNLPRRIN